MNSQVAAQKIVEPAQIEAELLRIWEALAKVNKLRACLFNLVVFNRLSARTDYIRSIVQRIIDTYPCRVLFISHDEESTAHYLKTAISVVSPSGEGLVACDHIDIGVAGVEWERVTSIVVPHIVPDLPVYLLWTENPAQEHPLFPKLAKHATRIIFDSESADHLFDFATALLKVKEGGKDVADLNWARLEGWRDLLPMAFETKERIADLREVREVKIVYNANKTEFFCHLQIQAMYLLALLASRLGWKVDSSKAGEQACSFSFEGGVRAMIEPELWPEVGPCVLSVEMTTAKKAHYACTRNRKSPQQVTIQASSLERCDLPVHVIFPGKIAMGQSLTREIFLKGTSPFFLQVLQQLTRLDQGRLC